MRFLPTRVHGVADYLMGVVLMVVPFLFHYPEGAATWLPVALGAGALVYSLLTNYELGVAPVIGMPAHLALDAGAGLLLMASPWLFGFSAALWAPHVIFGALEVGAAAFTQAVPSHGPRVAGTSPAG